jgi:hypothetical protein
MQKEINITKALVVTAEMCGGTEYSEAALELMVRKLSQFEEAAVAKALDRCQDEVKGRLALSDIIQRIEDGRPGAEEAWAMIPMVEYQSCVWTDEMSAAYGAINTNNMLDDTVAARMSFKETYNRLCAEARSQNKPVNWTWSPGTDETLRGRALVEAVEKKRMTASHALELAPHLVEDPLRARGLLPGQTAPQLPAPNNKSLDKTNDESPVCKPEEVEEMLSETPNPDELRAMFKGVGLLDD